MPGKIGEGDLIVYLEHLNAYKIKQGVGYLETTSSWTRTEYEIDRPADGRKMYPLRCRVCRAGFEVTFKCVAEIRRDVRRVRLVQLWLVLALLLCIATAVLWGGEMFDVIAAMLGCVAIAGLFGTLAGGVLPAVRQGAKIKSRKRHGLIVVPDD